MARKYYGKTAILIPHIGEQDTPDWLRIQLEAPNGIDRRKVLRAVRKFLKANFDVKVSNDFVHRCCSIINQHDIQRPQEFQSSEDKREFMDRLVLNIQEEEDKYAAQTGGYSCSEAEASEEAELEVPTLQGESTTLPTD